ncbi:hypothetical protein Tco_0900139, partial [Tanacetum coccineum]
VAQPQVNPDSTIAQIEDSISKEALGCSLAIKKAKTYRGRGYDKGQEAEQEKVKIMEDMRDKVVNMAVGDSDGTHRALSIARRVRNGFKPTISKGRLADDRTLDLPGVRDVVLKLLFGRLPVGFGVTTVSVVTVRIGMNMLASKGNVPDVRKVDIYFCKPGGLGKQNKLSFIMSEKTRKPQRLEQVDIEGVAFGVAERLSRTFRAESTGLCVEAPKMLWVDSVSTAYLIYRIPYVLIGLCIPKEEWRGNDTSLAHLKIPYGSSDTSEGFENSRSIKDSRRLDEEYSEDGESFKEGGSETPHVRRYIKESRALVRYSPSTNYLLLTENGEPESYSEALNYQQEKKALQSLWMFRVKEEQDGRKSIVASEDLHLEQLDVKIAFLHGDLDEDIYMTQSEGFSPVGNRRKPKVQIKENFVWTDSSTEATALTWQSSTSLSGSCPSVETRIDYSEKQVLGYVLIVGVTTLE